MMNFKRVSFLTNWLPKLIVLFIFFTVTTVFAKEDKVVTATQNQVISAETKDKLLKAAVRAQKATYSPYSKYAVGAALLTDNGDIILGTNVENASYGLTNCAERSAVFAAISEGYKNFIAVAIVTKDGGMPCGACRQVLNEFSPDILIVTSDATGANVKEAKLSSILPTAFGPQNLQ